MKIINFICKFSTSIIIILAVWSTNWQSMVFQNGGCRPLGFLKFKLLTVSTAWSKIPILHYRAKFHDNRSNRCWHIMIPPIFKIMSGILEFWKFEIFIGSGKLTCIIVPNFIEVCQTAAKIMRFKSFQKGGRLYLGFLKFQFLTDKVVKRPMVHQRASFAPSVDKYTHLYLTTIHTCTWWLYTVR